MLKKKNIDLSTKISHLSEQKKDFITDVFIALAKCDFRKKFLIWFLETRVQEGSPKVKEIEESVEQAERMTDKIISFITQGKKYKEETL